MATVYANTNTHIRSLKLPVSALLQQFKDQISVPLIRHFDLLYIQQGTGRLPEHVSKKTRQFITIL
jgi:proteasome component ECM29